MLKKTVTYEDYNGVSKTKDFYFNLNKAELMKMQLTEDGGLAESIEKIVAANNIPAIVEIFEKLVLDAYGEKAPDGEGFMKSDAIREGFKHHPAYPIIYMELATDADEAAKFINSVVPADMAKEVAQKQKAINAAEHPANK